MNEPKRYAVVDGEGNVVNSILLAEGSKWQPPAGHIIIQHDFAGPGGRFEGDEYVPPSLDAEVIEG